MGFFNKKTEEVRPEPRIRTIKCIKVSDKIILEPEWTEKGLSIPVSVGNRLVNMIISRDVCKSMMQDLLPDILQKGGERK